MQVAAGRLLLVELQQRPLGYCLLQEVLLLRGAAVQNADLIRSHMATHSALAGRRRWPVLRLSGAPSG